MRLTLIVHILLLALPLPSWATEISLSAAASLKEALNELADSYARRHPGVTIRRNFAATGTLAKQIEQGAPVDLFVSANQEWLKYLQERGLLDAGSIALLARNGLVFVGLPQTRATAMRELPSLARIAIGSPRSVPAGQYALEAIRKSGIERHLSGRLVQTRDVREALLYAQRGEVDGAFVYRSDALLARAPLKILFSIPEMLHGPITYPAALTTVGGKRPESRSFLLFLRSDEARHVLERHGFLVK